MFYCEIPEAHRTVWEWYIEMAIECPTCQLLTFKYTSSYKYMQYNIITTLGLDIF